MSDDPERDVAVAQQQVMRGDNAKRLLEDPLLVEAFLAVREDLKSKLFNTLPSQAAEREKLYLCARLLEMVEQEITHHVQTGQIAKASLAERVKGTIRRAAEPLRKRVAA